MSGIRGRDTTPELMVRSHLHRAGLRFRLHGRLSGKPDLVLKQWQAVVFVHGCFWHRHPGCPKTAVPRSNRAFWRDKFEANVERDRRAASALRRAGWRVFTIWECKVGPRELDRLVNRIRRTSE